MGLFLENLFSAVTWPVPMGDLLIEVWLYYQLVNIMLHSNISQLKVILFNGPNILLSTTQISSVT